ncbi:DUF6157 family protein [uncultured Paenibacillus sp.]|uniref:DUF6157 family protein n=1 Tax=uncultured Paenibacillus sp. TaxID=227322 RepID=UPI0035A62369
MFSKTLPCPRASALPKRYGRGIRYDEQGRIAIYGMDSPEYQRYAASTDLQLLNAMRSSRKQEQTGCFAGCLFNKGGKKWEKCSIRCCRSMRLLFAGSIYFLLVRRR